MTKRLREVDEEDLLPELEPIVSSDDEQRPLGNSDGSSSDSGDAWLHEVDEKHFVYDESNAILEESKDAEKGPPVRFIEGYLCRIFAILETDSETPRGAMHRLLKKDVGVWESLVEDLDGLVGLGFPEIMNEKKGDIGQRMKKLFFQYKTKNNSIHGPFSLDILLGWERMGCFKENPIEVRMTATQPWRPFVTLAYHYYMQLYSTFQIAVRQRSIRQVVQYVNSENRICSQGIVMSVELL